MCYAIVIDCLLDNLITTTQKTYTERNKLNIYIDANCLIGLLQNLKNHFGAIQFIKNILNYFFFFCCFNSPPKNKKINE